MDSSVTIDVFIIFFIHLPEVVLINVLSTGHHKLGCKFVKHYFQAIQTLV